MSLFDCIQDAMDDPEVQADKTRGEQAQRIWKELSDSYERQGYSRHDAETLAGEDVKQHFRNKAGEDLHVAISKAAALRRMQQRVNSSDKLGSVSSQSIDLMDMEARGLKRYLDGRLAAFFKEHHTDLLGRITKPAQMHNVVKALYGEAVDDEVAKAFAKAIQDTLEETRIMFNSAGGIIRKMDNYDLPHSHNGQVIRRAGRQAWVDFVLKNDMLDWSKIENHMTGQPFAVNGRPPSIDIQERFLGEVWDNIAYGKNSKDAVYGRPQGVALFRRKAEARHLHFRNSDKWIEYNKKFGSGDAYKGLTTHLHAMARDIAAMRTFGPNPRLGADYQGQLIGKRARDEGLDPRTGKFDINHASKMMNLYMGAGAPEGTAYEHSAAFFSTTRHVMTSAMLDKAIIPSISDLNTTRLAAKAAALNPGNIMATYGSTIKQMISDGSMMTDDLLRHQWVMDTLSDPGSAVARFQQEVPAAEWAERLSAASMRVQGLAQHTDTLKFAFQSEFWGTFAKYADRALDDVDPDFRKVLTEHGITAKDWDTFRADGVYSAPNGATFLNPQYWLATTDIPRPEALDTFFKFSGLVEKWQEIAVPSNSLYGKAFFDPVAFGLSPGSPMFEIMKSAGMFKSFVATFTVNQIRMIARQPDAMSRSIYVAELAGGATVMGGLALVIGEVIKGNDPMDMRPWENPDFWFRAMARGGGFGIIGDIVSTGEASWGGGFGSYVAGPMPQALDDVWDLTASNIAQLARGEDTNFQSELIRNARRYTPMADTPLLGPAVQRLVFDSIHRIIDPDADEAMSKAARARENRDGNEAFWPMGEPVPTRAPNLGAILGQ